MARFEVMSACHASCIGCLLVLGIVVLSIIAAYENTHQYTFDDGDIYNCPFDVANAGQAKALQDFEYTSKGELKNQHGQSQDYFFDPMHCNLFYKDPSAPVWFGRVEDLSGLNQQLFVYGFIPANKAGGLIDTQFELHYRVNIRAKMTHQEDWTKLNSSQQTRKVECQSGSDLCAWFQVAIVKTLAFQMYDVAIEVLPSPGLDSQDNPINFRIVYVNQDFTKTQLASRATFSVLSFGLLMLYLSKVACRVEGKLSLEQQGILGMTFLLFLFNDPVFMIHIYSPSIFTFFISELFTAAFLCALMIFWLVEAGKGGRLQPDQDEKGCYKRMARQAVNFDSCGRLILVAMYYLLVVDIMVVQLIYLYGVKADPGFELTHPKRSQKHPILEIATATTVILFTYYFWFVMALIQNCVGNSPKRHPLGKVIFAVSCFFHVTIMYGAISGFFSKRFSNGGVQFLFWGLSNLYMAMLVYFYWPVQTTQSQQRQAAERHTDAKQLSVQKQQSFQLSDQLAEEELEAQKAQPNAAAQQKKILAKASDLRTQINSGLIELQTFKHKDQGFQMQDKGGEDMSTRTNNIFSSNRAMLIKPAEAGDFEMNPASADVGPLSAIIEDNQQDWHQQPNDQKEVASVDCSQVDANDIQIEGI